MQLVERSRELATDPNYADKPVVFHTDTVAAKVEADAHFAIASNRYSHELLYDDARAEWFNEIFTDYLAGITRRGAPNSTLNLKSVAASFHYAFQAVYLSRFEAQRYLARDIVGQKIRQASPHYAKMGDTYTGVQAIEDVVRTNSPHALYEQYRDPANPLLNGIEAVQSLTIGSIGILRASKLGEEDRKEHLEKAILRIKTACSLTMSQSKYHLENGEPVLHDGRLDFLPNMAAVRCSPKFTDDVTKELRGHNMCPALVYFSPNALVPGGSAIEKTWKLGARLITANNLHMLDSDAPEHAVLPK